MQKLQNDADEVAGIMKDNCEKIMERDEKLSELDERAEELKEKVRDDFNKKYITVCGSLWVN